MAEINAIQELKKYNIDYKDLINFSAETYDDTYIKLINKIEKLDWLSEQKKGFALSFILFNHITLLIKDTLIMHKRDFKKGDYEAIEILKKNIYLNIDRFVNDIKEDGIN